MCKHKANQKPPCLDMSKTKKRAYTLHRIVPAKDTIRLRVRYVIAYLLLQLVKPRDESLVWCQVRHDVDNVFVMLVGFRDHLVK